MALLTEFTKTLLDHAVNDARTSGESVQTQMETLKTHYENLKSTEIMLHEHYQQRIAALPNFDGYFAAKKEKWAEWKKTKSKQALIEYLTMPRPQPSQPLSAEIYTRCV